MSTINTSYSQMPSLASYLTGSQTGSGTGTGSLVSLLGNNDNSASNSLFSFFEQNSGMRTYNLPVDSNGKTVIPTVDEMNASPTPDTMLTMANYVAQTVLMQSDAAAKTGIAARAGDITNQAQSVLQALTTSVTSLTNDGTTALSDAQQQKAVSTLSAINTALSQIVGLLPKTDATTRASLDTQLSNLDALGYNIAGAVGASWTSVTGNSANTISGVEGSTSNSNANQGLLNMTV